MWPGGESIGSAALGGLSAGSGSSGAFAVGDFLRTRIHALRQPAPLLQLYEVEVPDGSFLRYVDFWDKDSGASQPGKILFNGAEFDSIPITRGEISESAEGGSFQLPVTVNDPTHSGAFFIRQYGGLIGVRVNFWIAAADRLEEPLDAFRETFEVISSSISQGPDSVTIILGHPNLYEARVPKLFYDRRRCISPYHNRFTPSNWCNYPSNEFSRQTQKDYTIGAIYGDQDLGHGWRSQYARHAALFDADISNAGVLTISTSESRISWKGRDRYGPNFYRRLTADFDVETQILLPDTPTSRLRWMAGLLCQDRTPAVQKVAEGEEPSTLPASSWIFWGQQDDGAGGVRLARRKTAQSVISTDAPIAATDIFIRMKRAGSSFTLFSRGHVEEEWAQREVVTLTMPSDIQVGLVLASDQRSSAELTARFGYVRFSAGGLPACKFTMEDCVAHENEIQFNGFREMPDDRPRL